MESFPAADISWEFTPERGDVATALDNGARSIFLFNAEDEVDALTSIGVKPNVQICGGRSHPDPVQFL